MGCCILGALIISRWIYAIRRARRSPASFCSALTGLLHGLRGDRRSALLTASVAAEFVLFGMVAAHDLNGHRHDLASSTHETVAVVPVAVNAICANTD